MAESRTTVRYQISELGEYTGLLDPVDTSELYDAPERVDPVGDLDLDPLEYVDPRE